MEEIAARIEAAGLGSAAELPRASRAIPRARPRSASRARASRATCSRRPTSSRRACPPRDVARLMVDHFLSVWRPIEPRRTRARPLDARGRGARLADREGDRRARGAPADRGGVPEPPRSAACGSRPTPPVIYGIAGFDGNLRRIHLEDATNPYNTYQHAGLPPGPIANPGAAALRAVVEPADGGLPVLRGEEGRHAPVLPQLRESTCAP